MIRRILFAIVLLSLLPNLAPAQEQEETAPAEETVQAEEQPQADGEPAAPEPATAEEGEEATPEETPAQAEAVSEETPPPVTVESLEARLGEVQDALKQAEAAAQAEAPDPIAEVRANHVAALQDLEHVLQRRITSLKRLDEVRTALADLEAQKQTFETDGLDSKPPYTISFLDQMRDELEAARRETESDTQSLDTLQTSAEQADRRLTEAGQERRDTRDALEALPTDADRTEAELRLAVAQVNQELAEREVSQAKAQKEITELQKQLNEGRAALLQDKIAFVAENVLFTQKELDQQLTDLQNRQDALDRELREARRTDTANQRRLESARSDLEAASGEENIRRATEALAAREAWAQASSRAVELLQERMDNLSKAKALWERRFALRQGGDEAELAEWESDTAALLDEFARRREDLERRLRDLRVTKVEVDNRLAAPETLEAVKPELQSRIKAIEKREEQANAYLAGLIGVERLAQRVLSEVEEERKIDSWRGTWSRVLFTGEEIWKRELFAIDDRGFHTGDLVLAALFFCLVMIVAYVARGLMRRTVLRHLRETAGKTESIVDDVLLAIVKSTRTLFVVAIGLYVALKSLPLSEEKDGWLDSFAVIAVVLQSAMWANAAIQRAIDRTKAKRVAEDPSSVSAFGLMSFFGRVSIWAVALLIALQNLGVEITALVASLGIGGIAIAFALQNILGDVFCSIAILLDKPFVVGDFIIVGDLMGNVENIGIKTTRIRSLGGEQIVFSNADLIGSRIRNYKRMYERRIVFGFGVVYETPAEKLEEIPGIVKHIVESSEKTRFDRAHFKEYGDFSLNFEVVYYVLVADYNVYMDIQQRINLEIFREFQQRGIAFAYPTQELIVRRNGVHPAEIATGAATKSETS
jgi:small-conductance mechanosensitive channel